MKLDLGKSKKYREPINHLGIHGNDAHTNHNNACEKK
jgi:hypothetical protein